jgi:hypothetical protein
MEQGNVAGVVLGLSGALALAVLAAHPAVRDLERRLGISVLLSGGLAFLGLGAIFALPGIAVLSPKVLGDLRPIFDFGLGWIGFAIGIHFDVERLERLPSRIGGAIAAATLAPALTTAAMCGLALVALGTAVDSPTLTRDLLILAACAAASAPMSAESLAKTFGAEPAERVEELTSLNDIVALLVLGVAAVLYRPTTVATQWVLPQGAWLIVILGVGALFGALTYVLVRGTSGAESMAGLIGAVALVSGTAGTLALPAPIVGAMAGALLANLPLREPAALRATILDVERPLYLLFLLIAGASWRPDEWQGWALAVVFVAARTIGKRLGARWASRAGPDGLPAAGPLALALIPHSPVAVVVIVSAAGIFAGTDVTVLRWAINAVIIGGILSEVVARLLRRRHKLAVAEPAGDEAFDPLVPGAYR